MRRRWEMNGTRNEDGTGQEKGHMGTTPEEVRKTEGEQEGGRKAERKMRRGRRKHHEEGMPAHRKQASKGAEGGRGEIAGVDEVERTRRGR